MSLSLYLFNLFIEKIINKLKTNFKGININREIIHSIRFTNDITLMTESEKVLQDTLSIFIASSMLNKYKKIS